MNISNILEQYQEHEIAQISLSNEALVKKGKITSFHDLYPELVDVSDKSISYCRGLTPLQMLLLLYDKVVLHIPALPQSLIEARYGLSLESIWQLIEGGVVLPVINNPADYTQPHLVEFLQRRAPSVWVRGVNALSAFGLEETLEEASCVLPVSDMAKVPKILSRFKSRYPLLGEDEVYQRVKHDILVNYADLCIFGLREFAGSLVELGEPESILDHLYLYSELITYPHLFGFGGTANFDEISVLRDVEFMPINVAQYINTNAVAGINPKTADRLLRSIGVEMADVDWKDIVEFHGSGDGERLRNAMSRFEDAARIMDPNLNHAEQVIQYHSELDAEIQQATRVLSSPAAVKAMKPDKIKTVSVQVGIAAVGGLCGFFISGPIGAFAGAAAPVLLEAILPDRIRSMLTLSDRTQLQTPALANLWAIRGHR